MASGGPQKITADEIKKFQTILRLPAGEAKSSLIKALSSEERVHLKAYTEHLKLEQEKKRLHQEQAARLEALRLKELELKALQDREQSLLSRDKSHLTPAAASYSRACK